jgi:hypothetical protein
MKTPETIQHEGKTLERLPCINDTTRLDFILEHIGKKGFDDLACGICSREDIDAAIEQSAYREKAEAYEWIPAYYEVQNREQINKLLTNNHGSPEALMRKGAEQAIENLSDEISRLPFPSNCDDFYRRLDDFYRWSENVDVLVDENVDKLVKQALKNCRPKGEKK